MGVMEVATIMFTYGRIESVYGILELSYSIVGLHSLGRAEKGPTFQVGTDGRAISLFATAAIYLFSI